MSEQEWDALRAGDIVIERRSRTPRIVLDVTVRKSHKLGCGPCVSIRLRKLRSSQFDPCNSTVLVKSDMRMRLDVAHGRRAKVTAAMLWCPRHGFSHRHKAEPETPATKDGKP